MLPSLPARCWAEIDLGALERNLHAIRAALPLGIRYVAVVKADAYGHGLHQTVARLMHCGADAFAVATVAEAAQIREIGGGWPILVLGASLPEEVPMAVELGLSLTLSTPEEVDAVEAEAARRHRNVPVHLKIDTGMGRLGVWHEEVAPLHARIHASPHLTLEGAFTHFASAESDPEFTDLQRRLFIRALERMEGCDPSSLLIHADNSAGLTTFAGSGGFNAVRVGLLQFGVLPYPESLLGAVQVEPVLSFHTRVVLTKHLPAGSTIGYGRTRTLARNTRTAVIAAGYGDGLPRAASNRGQVLIHGRRCPILGRVSMDQTVVDVTEVPEASRGDPVVLIGRQGAGRIDSTEFSEWGDTIAWETLCSLTKRVPRLYRTTLGT